MAMETSTKLWVPARVAKGTALVLIAVPLTRPRFQPTPSDARATTNTAGEPSGALAATIRRPVGHGAGAVLGSRQVGTGVAGRPVRGRTGTVDGHRDEQQHGAAGDGGGDDARAADGTSQIPDSETGATAARLRDTPDRDGRQRGTGGGQGTEHTGKAGGAEHVLREQGTDGYGRPRADRPARLRGQPTRPTYSPAPTPNVSPAAVPPPATVTCCATGAANGAPPAAATASAPPAPMPDATGRKRTDEPRTVRLADGGQMLRVEDLKTSEGPDVRVWLSARAADAAKAGLWGVRAAPGSARGESTA